MESGKGGERETDRQTKRERGPNNSNTQGTQVEVDTGRGGHRWKWTQADGDASRWGRRQFVCDGDAGNMEIIGFPSPESPHFPETLQF